VRPQAESRSPSGDDKTSWPKQPIMTDGVRTSPFTVEIQQQFDSLAPAWQQHVFVKLYTAALASGFLRAISDRDWKALGVAVSTLPIVFEVYCSSEGTRIRSYAWSVWAAPMAGSDAKSIRLYRMSPWALGRRRPLAQHRRTRERLAWKRFRTICIPS